MTRPDQGSIALSLFFVTAAVLLSVCRLFLDKLSASSAPFQSQQTNASDQTNQICKYPSLNRPEDKSLSLPV